MREEVRDPQRLEHMLEALNSLIHLSEREDLNEIQEKDIKYFGIIKLL